MNVMGMKVSQETLVYCFIAFLVGYFFTSLWGSVCRCKQVEGWTLTNKATGKCEDNRLWAENNPSCGSEHTFPNIMACIKGAASSRGDKSDVIVQKLLEEKYGTYPGLWSQDAWEDRCKQEIPGGGDKTDQICKLAVKQKDKFLDEMGSMTPEQIKKKGELVKKALGDCVNPESLVRYSDEFQSEIALAVVGSGGSEGYTDYASY